MLSAALMADQPDSGPGTEQRARNGHLLSELLHQSEHLLRRQATRHAERPDDVEDALQSAYTLFLERFKGDCEPLAWLYTTVKREAWAIRRRASRRSERSFEWPASESDGTFDLSHGLATDSPGPHETAERQEAARRAAPGPSLPLSETNDVRCGFWPLASVMRRSVTRRAGLAPKLIAASARDARH